jgi:hypothetical protein
VRFLVLEGNANVDKITQSGLCAGLSSAICTLFLPTIYVPYTPLPLLPLFLPYPTYLYLLPLHAWHTSVHIGAKFGKCEVVRFLVLEGNVSVNKSCDQLWYGTRASTLQAYGQQPGTPLAFAARAGAARGEFTDVMKFLLEANAFVDQTTLYMCAEFGLTELARLLVSSRKVKVNEAKTEGGDTALVCFPLSALYSLLLAFYCLLSIRLALHTHTTTRTR